MADERLPLTELLEKAGEGDFLRAVAEAVLQLLMEADVEGLIGAGRYERNVLGSQAARPKSADLRPHCAWSGNQRTFQMAAGAQSHAQIVRLQKPRPTGP